MENPFIWSLPLNNINVIENHGKKITNPYVIIVILCWNNHKDTIDCLESLHILEYTNFSTILVDNGSTDGTIAIVKDRFPGILIIENKKNLGYATGNNVGITHAINLGANYIFILNNDTVLDPSCVTHLISDLEEHPDAAAAAPKSYLFGTPDTVYFAGGQYDPGGNAIQIGCGKTDDPQYCISQNTQWLAGCAMMLRTKMLKHIGLFDPDYFLLWEDVDWSIRAQQRGYTLRFNANAKIWHKTSSSFGHTWNPSYLYYYTRNYCLFIERNNKDGNRVRLCLRSIKMSWSQTKRRGELRLAVILGAIDYLLRRYGARDYFW